MRRSLSALTWLAWLAVCLLGRPAFAQTFSLGQRTPSEGIVMPPESAATVEDAASGTLNPAGLGLMHGLQLEYFHSRETIADGVTGDGVYAAGTLFDVLSLGLSLEWMRPDGGPSFHKTHWTVALSPNRTLSVAVAYNLFGSSDAGLNSLTSWDLGVTWRPFSFISLAGSARDLDNPQLDGVPLPRRFDLALALRPFGSAFTLAGDYLFFTDGDVPSLNGANNGRVGVTAQLNVAGIGVVAGAGIPVGQNQVAYGQIGVSLATEHVAAFLGWAPALSGDTPLGNRLFDVGLRLSAESFHSLPVPLPRVLSVDLAQVLKERSNGPLGLLGASSNDPFEELLDALANAERDRGVRAVLFKLDGAEDLSGGRVEELRAAIGRLRAQGKLTASLLGGGGDRGYYLASACERVYALPLSDFSLHGFTSDSLYFAEGLHKLGVNVEVVRVGPYKSAPDALTRDDPSPESLEVTRAILADAMGRYEAAVEQSRGVTAAELEAILARGLATSEELKAARLVDAVLYPDEIGKELSRQLHGQALFEDVQLSPDANQPAWSDLPEIAVINVFGLITGGESQTGPFDFARTSGARTIAAALRQAEADSSVAAVVVRVDSGGGDGAASELIWRAIQEVRRRKPVVVSFGDVAASGGYYLAVAGDEILAEPSTITGSIGVFALKPDLSGLLGKLGIHPHEEAVTPNANLFSIAGPWTAPERDVIQHYIDAFYGTFVARVSAGRRMTPEAVEAIGRGHVWTGAQAKERGLIDGFGSFEDAVAHAKARAHLARDQQVRVVTLGGAKALVQLGGLVSGLFGGLFGQASAAGQIETAIRAIADKSGLAPALLYGPGQALALPEQLPILR